MNNTQQKECNHEICDGNGLTYDAFEDEYRVCLCRNDI